MCQDSGERSRALGLSYLCEDFNANLKLYLLFVYGTSLFPKTIILNNFNISTKCKVELLPKAAHFGLSHTYLNIFFSENTWLIELKFQMEYALDKTIYHILFQVT